MLNETYLLRFIENKLGFKFNELELSHEEILDVIKMETLLTFSTYHPKQELIQLKENMLIGDSTNRYYINASTPIISVAKVYDSSSNFGVSGVPGVSAGGTNPIEKQKIADLLSMTRNPTTFKFEAPNIITIMPAMVTFRNMSVVLNCIHEENFLSIPIGLQTAFLKLALLDIKENLYAIRHRFVNLQTAYGSIELFIDELSSAKDEKRELLETWDKNYGRSSRRKRVYVF